MKNSLVASALLSLLCTGVIAQESIEPTDVLLSKINPLLTSQAGSIRYFTAPSDMVAIGVVTKKRDKRVYYTNPQGDFLLSGMLFDVETSKSFNNQILAQLVLPPPPPLVEEWTAPLSELQSITVGNGENHVYAFVDLSCGFCHRFHKEVKEREAKGLMDNITMHYVLINIMNPTKQANAASIIGQTDTTLQYALLDSGMQRGNIPVNESVRQAGSRALLENQRAWKQFPMAGGVPFIVAQSNGKWTYTSGVPSEAFYAQLDTSSKPVQAVAP